MGDRWGLINDYFYRGVKKGILPRYVYSGKYKLRRIKKKWERTHYPNYQVTSVWQIAFPFQKAWNCITVSKTGISQAEVVAWK